MPLVDPYFKTTRAKEHLDSLRQEVDAFIESQPCEFLEQLDSKNQRYRIRLKVKDAPSRFSLIAGDVFGCLRASLDHLIWCLATRNTGFYAEGTQFPILEQADAPRFARHTSGVPAEALSIIEYLQPYHATNTYGLKNHLLWRLNKLCNIDKHRRIPLHGAVVDFQFNKSLGQPTFDDDQTMSWPLSAREELSLKSEMTLYPEVSYKVVFGDATEGIECDLKGIDEIYKFVAEDAIPQFARFVE